MANRFRLVVVSIALGVCVLAILLITLTPSPVDQPVAALLNRVLIELHERGLPTFIGYRKIEFGANIALFVPIGFFVALLLPARLWWITLLVGPLLSGTLEGTQLLLLPARYASLNDILANTTGAVLGAIAAILLRMLVNHRDQLVLADVRSGRRPS